MREVTVKEIQELTEMETECLLANYNVQQEILESANESEAYHLDEIFYCISHSLSVYRIEEVYNSFIMVKDYQDFYEGVMRMSDWYDVFYGTDIIERLDSIYETYYTTVDKDEFIKHMKPLENEITKILGGYANWYSSYDQLEYETDYIMIWLENNYDKECIVDGDNVTLLNY